MAKKVIVEQQVLEGCEHLVNPKIFKIYVEGMPEPKNNSDIEIQNRQLDMIEAVLDGKSIEECKSESEEAKDFFDGLIEVEVEDLPFDVEEEKQESVKEEKQEHKETEEERIDRETEEEKFRNEIEEKYSLPWWQR